MKILLSFLFAALCSGCMSLSEPYAKPADKDVLPPVVAVCSFDNRSGFQGQWTLGSGMADLLVSELVSSKNFIVVERGQLNSVVGEIDMQKDKHFRTEGRVEDGRLKGARYLVRGVINDFSQTGGGAISVALRTILFGGRGYKAKVALTLTIVDVETGQILDAVQCSASACASSAYASTTYKNVAFGGEMFFKTPLGSATANAIRKGVNIIIAKVPPNKWEPMIAEVENSGRIILNGGSGRDFKTGVLQDVREHGRIVTDPGTGDVLTVLPGPTVGTIRITQVDEKISFAQPVKGTNFKRGQLLVPYVKP
jgi:curli biogenesis system outer membrane secretion channel CsgG